MALSHGRVTIFKLDDLVGSLQDISSYFRSASGLQGKADRPNTDQFGDAAVKKGILGLRDGGPISLAGLWKSSAAGAAHGKGVKIAFDEYSLVGRTKTASVKRTIELPDSQQFGAEWRERDVVGKISGGFSFGGNFNGAANDIDAICRGVYGRAASAVCSVGYAGFAVGSLVDLLKAAMTNYGIDSGHDKLVEVSADFDGDDAVELGVSLHDLVAETAAAPQNYATVDESASSSSGGVAHLHVTGFAGSTATFKVQHSTDGSVWVDLITFTAVTGVGVQRMEVAGTVNRYVRAILSAGTYTSVTFTVAFARRGYTYGTAGTFRHLAGLQAKVASSSFEFGPEGSTAGSRKLSGESRLSSLSVDLKHDDLLSFSAELMVSGAVAEATF